MICRADTIGVFQIESRAQMSMLPRLRPGDSTIWSSRWRSSGRARSRAIWCIPISSGGSDRATTGRSTIRSPELKAVLERTLGVPLFQEQAMQIAITAAGFHPAKADKLRRSMATFKRPGQVNSFEKDMIDGMVAQWLSTRLRRTLLQPDRGFWRIWLSGKPCGLLRAARLCLLLGQGLLSRCLLRGASEFAADGFLCAGAAGA